jgi:hypothetical protein
MAGSTTLRGVCVLQVWVRRQPGSDLKPTSTIASATVRKLESGTSSSKLSNLVIFENI